MSTSATQPKSDGYLVFIFTLCAIAAAWYFGINPHKAHGADISATPNLVILGDAHGQTPLTITSDSTRAWKKFAVSGGSAGAYSIVSAEHGTGDDGGIYFYSVSISTGTGNALPGPNPPPGPAPSDLPISALTSACKTAVAGVDATLLAKMADAYETMGTSIDKGVIISPLQLQLMTATQLLGTFDANQLSTFANFSNVVSGWFDAQQCAGKLTSDNMAKYSTAYHAVAAAVRPSTPAAAKPKESKPASKSPCADGHCPKADAPTRWGWFRR